MKNVIEMCKEADAEIVKDGDDNRVTFYMKELETFMAIHKEEVLAELRIGPIAYIKSGRTLEWNPYCSVTISPTCAVVPIPLYTLPDKELKK